MDRVNHESQQSEQLEPTVPAKLISLIMSIAQVNQVKQVAQLSSMHHHPSGLKDMSFFACWFHLPQNSCLSLTGVSTSKYLLAWGSSFCPQTLKATDCFLVELLRANYPSFNVYQIFFFFFWKKNQQNRQTCWTTSCACFSLNDNSDSVLLSPSNSAT